MFPASRRAKLFVVAEDSMRPSLLPGDAVIGFRSRRAKPGQIRIFRSPLDVDMWLVKRVSELVDDDEMYVLSDNTDVTRADSRTFGPVPVDGSYRVVLKLPRRRVDVR